MAAPALIYLKLESARMNAIRLTVSGTQESSLFFFPLPLMNRSSSAALNLWMYAQSNSEVFLDAVDLIRYRRKVQTVG